jgi:hypothetical protein
MLREEIAAAVVALAAPALGAMHLAPAATTDARATAAAMQLDLLAKVDAERVLPPVASVVDASAAAVAEDDPWHCQWRMEASPSAAHVEALSLIADAPQMNFVLDSYATNWSAGFESLAFDWRLDEAPGVDAAPKLDWPGVVEEVDADVVAKRPPRPGTNHRLLLLMSSPGLALFVFLGALALNRAR